MVRGKCKHCGGSAREIHANPEHFFKAFEHAASNSFMVSQALLFSRKMSEMGHIDASEGYLHYALKLMCVSS